MKKNTIINMDCIKGMRQLESFAKIFDIIVTSPPYNYGHPYIGYRDDKDHQEYLRWLNAVVQQMKRVLAHSGSAFINIQPPPKNPEYIADIINEVHKHFTIQNVIHWVKSITIKEKTTGRIRNISSSRYLNNEHEYIIHATRAKTPIHLNKDKDHIRSNVWFMERANPNKYRELPPKFPIELAKRCIELHGIHKDTLVLDPFMGMGTTAIACRGLGVDYYGFEIDDLICDLAEERIKKWVKKNG